MKHRNTFTREYEILKNNGIMYKNQKIITDGITVEDFLDLLTEKILQEIKRMSNSLSNPNPQEILTRKQVCELLHITTNTLHRWIKQGKIKAHNAGGRVLIRRGDAEAVLQEKNNLKLR